MFFQPIRTNEKVGLHDDEKRLRSEEKNGAAVLRDSHRVQPHCWDNREVHEEPRKNREDLILPPGKD
jgi:hypothetical protein